MWKYILKRIGLMIINIFIVLVILFTLIRLLPVTVATNSNSEKAALIAYYTKIGCTFSYNSGNGMVTVTGKPIPEQLFIYLKNVFSGNLGISTSLMSTEGSKKVIDIINERFSISILLNIYSLFICIPLGLFFGILAALKKNKWQDNVISIVVMLFISVPSFVIAILLQYFLGYKAGIGTIIYSEGNPRSMLLPVLALSFGSIASLTRYTRAELTEVLTSDFMLLARAKGLTRSQATVRHALRNSMVPVMPIIIWNFIGILGGSYIVEQIFSIPGVGKLTLTAISATPPDYDLYIAMSMFYTILGFAGSLIVDLSYGLVDPRIRIGGKK